MANPVEQVVARVQTQPEELARTEAGELGETMGHAVEGNLIILQNICDALGITVEEAKLIVPLLMTAVSIGLIMGGSIKAEKATDADGQVGAAKLNGSGGGILTAATLGSGNLAYGFPQLAFTIGTTLRGIEAKYPNLPGPVKKTMRATTIASIIAGGGVGLVAGVATGNPEMAAGAAAITTIAGSFSSNLSQTNPLLFRGLNAASGTTLVLASLVAAGAISIQEVSMQFPEVNVLNIVLIGYAILNSGFSANEAFQAVRKMTGDRAAETIQESE